MRIHRLTTAFGLLVYGTFIASDVTPSVELQSIINNTGTEIEIAQGNLKKGPLFLF